MRKERDLNPRYPLGVCVLSRDVLSATQPSFQKKIKASNFEFDVQLKSPFAESDVSLIPYSLRLLGPLLTEFSRKASYRVYISFLDEIL